MAKRSRPEPGFYTYLHNSSSVDCKYKLTLCSMIVYRCHGAVDGCLNRSLAPTKKTLTVHHQGEERGLPSGIFLVDRLVTTRPSKSHIVSVIDNHYYHKKIIVLNVVPSDK